MTVDSTLLGWDPDRDNPLVLPFDVDPITGMMLSIGMGRTSNTTSISSKFCTGMTVLLGINRRHDKAYNDADDDNKGLQQVGKFDDAENDDYYLFNYSFIDDHGLDGIFDDAEDDNFYHYEEQKKMEVKQREEEEQKKMEEKRRKEEERKKLEEERRVEKERTKMEEEQRAEEEQKKTEIKKMEEE